MDQIKIGRFIAEYRKAKNLTQVQLAEKLSITDRAVSKWERGKGMPDASLMLELCDILDISVTELLRGERIETRDYDKAAEETILAMKAETERQNAMMLRLEIILGIISVVSAFSLLFIGLYAIESTALSAILYIIAGVIFFIGMSAGLKIEQTAGYYKCAACGHRYVPSYSAVYLAMHFGRTRYMKCPKCGKWSWNHKVLS